MDKDLSIKAMELIQNGEFQEAYQIYSNEYEKNHHDLEALYLRSLIDFGHLRNNLNQTIADLGYLSSRKNKYSFPSMHLLTVHYDMIGDYNSVIIFGEQVKNVLINKSEDSKLLADIYFLLSRAHYFKNTKRSVETALKYINDVIELTNEDVDLDYYLFKIDILLVLKQYDEIEKVISIMQSTFGINGSLYHAKQKLFYAKAVDLINTNEVEAKDLFNQSLDNLEIYAKYENDSSYVLYTKVDILTQLKKYDDALKLLTESENEENKVDILIEKIKVYETMEDILTPIKLCEDFLKTSNSWKIKYSLGYLLAYTARTKESFIRIRELFLDAYKDCPRSFILYDLYPINNKLFNFEENYSLLKEYFNENELEGRGAYLLSMMAETTSRSYDEQFAYIEQAFYLRYISELEFLDEAMSSTSNPKAYYKILKKYQNSKLEDLDCWSKRKMGIRYLYGECGFKQNFDLAKKYLLSALDELPDVSCMQAMMGRFHEFTKNYEEMINYYQFAHQAYLNDEYKTCNCSEGYLAHAYINGIGVLKDEEKASKLILNAINDLGGYSSGIVIYLYTFFALKNVEGFNLEYAEELLNKTHAFKRYEITRYILLKQVLNKLNKNSTYLNSFLKECLKYGDKNTKKYYKENIKKEISYPLFSEF